MITRFVAYSEKCRKYMFSGGSAQSITILHRGGYQNLLQYYNGGGGVSWAPNLYYVIYGRPLNESWQLKVEKWKLTNESCQMKIEK